MAEAVVGWGRPVAASAVASPAPIPPEDDLGVVLPRGAAHISFQQIAVWHGFAAAGLGAPRPRALCGAVFDEVGPLCPQSSITGEVCHACRAAAGAAGVGGRAPADAAGPARV